MKSGTVTLEDISALLDGELSGAPAEAALAALSGAPAQSSWRIYQVLGELLRRDAEQAVPSEGFAARLAERLAQEVQQPSDDNPAAPAVVLP